MSKIKILFENSQWMVQNDAGTIFLVERGQDGGEGGYWVEARQLGHKESNGHTWLMQVCEKTWVDFDAFEQAARVAIRIANPAMDFDFDEEMARTRAICEPLRDEWSRRARSGIQLSLADLAKELAR